MTDAVRQVPVSTAICRGLEGPSQRRPILEAIETIKHDEEEKNKDGKVLVIIKR